MLIIWNLEDGSDQQTISVAFNGPVTSAVWMPVYQEAPNGAFAFGTADGNLFLYTHHKVCFVISTVVWALTFAQTYYEFAFSTTAHQGAIEDIAFDPYHKRLATVGDGCLKLWEINEKHKFSFTPLLYITNSPFSVVASNSVTTPPKSSISRCVSFLDEGRDILIGFLDSHEMYVGSEFHHLLELTYHSRLVSVIRFLRGWWNGAVSCQLACMFWLRNFVITNSF